MIASVGMSTIVDYLQTIHVTTWIGVKTWLATTLSGQWE